MKKIRPPTASNNSLFPKLKWHNSKIRVEFKGTRLQQDEVNFTPSSVVN